MSNKENDLDINLLNEQIGDDDENFRKTFLNLVIDQLAQAEENIKKSTAEKDSANLKLILHKLKGTAGTAGLLRLSERTASWENKTEPDMDFISMEKEMIREITTGLQLIKNLIQ